MRIFQREQRSLFGEILDWMLVPLLVIWPMSVVLTYLVAQNIAARPFDRALEQNAQNLAQLVRNQNPLLGFNLPKPARDILRADETDEVYFQVRDAKGDFVSGEPALPAPPAEANKALGEVALRNGSVLNNDVRIASVWLLTTGEPKQAVLVQVAETLEKRKLLATEIIKGVTIPQFFILPLALLLVWIALARAIRPLSDLEQTIRARKPEDLSPLQDHSIPQEVVPLLGSVNDLLTRLKISIATQKRFLADAAHQLKTPLAGLRMQADLAQRESSNPEDLKKSLSQIERASVRATHTVNQLLSLARAEASQSTAQMQVCDLLAIARETAQEAVPHALHKSINLGFEGDAASEVCQIRGNATMLKEMLSNLVDNAINYTPAGGEVTLRLLADRFGKVVLVQVEDQGIGVKEEERAAIFQPFYRSLGTTTDGSGLGLAIVLEIAQQHGASIELESPLNKNASDRPGSRFSLRFQAL